MGEDGEFLSPPGPGPSPPSVLTEAPVSAKVPPAGLSSLPPRT